MYPLFYPSALAIKKGFLTSKAARPDVHRSANFILRMVNDGKILLSFKPPGYFSRNDIKSLERIETTGTETTTETDED